MVVVCSNLNFIEVRIVPVLKNLIENTFMALNISGYP